MHLKRLVASKHYKIKKKERKFTVCPSPGPHKKNECIPLQIIIRNVLGHAKTAKESKKIINSGKMLVDERVKKDYKYPVGFMDVLKISEIKEQYRVIPKKGKLQLVPIPQKDAEIKLCQIKNKRLIKNGLIQLNLHDGRNISLESGSKDIQNYKVGDVLLISIPDQKIKKHIQLKEGNLAMISRGKYAGGVGKIERIIISKSSEPNKVVIEINKIPIQTLKDYVFPIGEKEPILKIE